MRKTPMDWYYETTEKLLSDTGQTNLLSQLEVELVEDYFKRGIPEVYCVEKIRDQRTGS